VALVAALAVLAALPALAQSKRAVGIVVELEGTTTPAVGISAELADKTALTLAADATLSFVHYKTCRLVVVKGGKVTLDAMHYDVTGQVLEEEKVSCPAEQASLAGSSQASGTAALVLRGGAGRTPVPIRPRIIAAGPRSAEFSKVEFLDGEKIVTSLPLAKGRAAWPKDAPALVAYREYTARFVPAKGAPVSFPVRADGALKGDGKAPTIFRIE
jgi:ferric-dicitrate binding protein FerR (iron transport regulator)